MATDSLIYETFDQTTPHTTYGPYTAEDYLQLPEGERVELLRGRLIMMSPAPLPRHQFVADQILIQLSSCGAPVGSITISSPIDVEFSPRTIAQPDVVYLRAEHRDRIKNRIYGAPDLVVEVLSPSTTARDRVEKLDLYRAGGVPEYWIVDSKTHVFEFNILDGGTYHAKAMDSGFYQSPLFSEVKLDVTAFWQFVEQLFPEDA